MPIKNITTSIGLIGRQKVIVFEFGLGTNGQPTEVAVNDETLRLPLPPDRSTWTFKRWTINGVLPPTGADGKVDIFLNGASILDSSKVTFPDGSSSALVTGTNFATFTGLKDAKVYAKVTAIGTTYAGKGWCVTLEIE